MLNVNRLNPIFSIIITCYKVEKYIRDVIDSVIKNGETDKLEIILVDDGSPDNCGKIIDAFSREYSFIKTVHQENRGPGGARNSGLREACGEYVFFLDGDDRMAEGVLHKVYNVITINPICDIITSNKHYYTNWEKSYVRETDLKLDLLNQKELRLRLAQDTYLAHSFYKRKMLIDSNKPFSEGRKLGEDQHWILNNVAFAKNIEVLDIGFYYHYEKRPGSQVNGFSDDMRIETLELMCKIYRDTDILPYSSEEMDVLKHGASCLFMGSGAGIFVDCYDKEIQRQAKIILNNNRDILECRQNKWRFLMKLGRIIGIRNALILYWKLKMNRRK